MNTKNVRGTKTPPARKASSARKRKVRFGVLKGSIRYPDDFDAPLPASVLTLFEGRRAK
jgi:hypothetical protein